MTLTNIKNIILIGDLHFGIRNNSIEWFEIQRDFFMNFLYSSIESKFNEDSDILILEGDIFHSRELLNIRILDEVRSLFFNLSKKFKRGIYILIGNHDTYYKDKNIVNSVSQLCDVSPNIHVIIEPTVLKINDDHNFLLLPWVEDIKKIQSIIIDHQFSCDYIICHADISGFRFNKFITIDNGISQDLLVNYKYVFSGHIHIRQENNNIIYTGTPYQMDRGDYLNTKGYYTLNVENSTLSVEFTENTYSPTFKKFNLFDLLNLSISEICDLFNNSFVDILINSDIIQKIQIPALLEALNNCGHKKLEIIPYSDKTSNILSTSNVSSESKISTEKMNISGIFKQYIIDNNYDSDFAIKLTKKFIEYYKLITQANL